MSTEHEPAPGQIPGLAPAPATTATTEASETPATATANADAYGQPISDERQVELQGYLDRWQAAAEHGDREGPFDYRPGQVRGVWLTGADVAWLAEQSGRDNNEDVPNLHLERANLAGAHLEQANLIGTTLDSKTVLNGATLDTKTRLGDMQWGGVGAVNLTQITWSAVPQLGDEQGVGIRSTDPCPDS